MKSAAAVALVAAVAVSANPTPTTPEKPIKARSLPTVTASGNGMNDLTFPNL